MPGGRPRKRLYCDICDLPFRTYSGIYGHNRLHHAAPRYSCPHCNEMFLTSARRGTHLAGVVKELMKTELASNSQSSAMPTHRGLHAG